MSDRRSLSERHSEDALEVTLANDAICIGPHFRVGFQRTLRIPDDGKQHPLPPGLGLFPLKAVADYASVVPERWRNRGGYFLPMHSREAMWLSFDAGLRPCAVKVGAGKINAVSGEAWSPDLAADPDRPDYVVCPDQPWLDGFNAEEGAIRQFVAVPLGFGYTAEEQITGAAEVGGIQLRIFEPKPGRFPDETTVRSMTDDFAVSCEAEGPTHAADMGLGAGGEIEQKIYPDPHGIDTWDQERAGEAFIHLADPRTYFEVTGELAPPSPVNADAYTRAGYPWFALSDNEAQYISAPDRLTALASVKKIDASKGVPPSDEDGAVKIAIDQIVKAD